jgi:hypothetical protein
VTNRFTLANQRMEADEPLRTANVRRMSSGFRYWLLVPGAFLVMYYSLLWSIFILLGYVPGVGRLRRAFGRFRVG